MTGFGRAGSLPWLAAVAALGLLIAGEVFAWRQVGPLHVPAAASMGRQSAPDDATRSPGRHAAWLREILARPLFSANRRPAEGGMRGLPRLTGTVLAGPERLAIFAGGDHPIVARVGGHVGAYEVSAITELGVTVSGPDGTTLIKPAFDPGRPAASTPPATAPQPARTAPK
jgi:hypothetical protein